MDFLDPQKQRAHMIRLLVGYVLVGVAVLIATLILLYQAYGFGLGKDGEVIQKGLVFVSSQPNPAKLYLDSKLYKSDTNTKLQLQAGQYKAELQREGYRSWERILTVEGGSVQHYDYPQLFPTNMTSSSVKAYPEAPGFASQSPDRRWLVIQQGSAPLAFDVIDVADPKKLAAGTTNLVLPDGIVTTVRVTAHAYKLVEWSTDNRRILLQHTYTPDGGSPASEYIVLDRQVPAESVNLTRTLALVPGKVITLRDKKFDKYYVYDTAARTLGTMSISDAGAVTPLLEQVVAYKTYGSDTVLYITDKDTTTAKPLAAGIVHSMLLDNDRNYKIREHGAIGPFLIDLARYNNKWYVAVGASSDSKVYVYRNPQQIRKSSQTATLVPVRILRVIAPNYLSFSSNTQFIMTENGVNFADYDAENDEGYTFKSKFPLDLPASHAAWMDSHRIAYVSGGKVVVFDYDNINAQTLAAASPNYTPFFDRDYSDLYTLVPTPSQNGTAGMTLTLSSLRIPADQ